MAATLYSRIFIIIGLLMLLSFEVHAQNLEEIGLKKGINFNGSINLNTVGYHVTGIEQRRDPFNWYLTGSLNIDFFGYSAPLSFSYSNTNKSFSQPFNQFSFAPSYKWVKTYIGYNSMTFSNYTLAGHIFLGGGVELTLGNWRVSAMYGRLKKAVPFHLEDSLQYHDAAYKRMGYGLKVGYEQNGDEISANVFTAKDDIHSIPFTIAESQLTPQHNIAFGTKIRKRLFSKFFVEAEYALSVMNTDIRANTGREDSIGLAPTHNIIKGLLPENLTSRYYDALNASLGYHGTWYMLQLKYERVSPEYQTLGAYYFNNDLRNISIAPSVRLLKNTLNLSGNFGLQKNNLDETRASTTHRFVSAMNVSYLPSELWNLTLNYSNFSSYTNIRPQPDPYFKDDLDTLDFYQVSQTMAATIVRSLGNVQAPQSLLLSGTYQQASDQASYEGGDTKSSYVTVNASYSYALIPSNTTLVISGNTYINNTAGMKSLYWGPTLSASKSFKEKAYKISLASSYNETSGGDIQTSPVLNNRINASYSPQAKDTDSKIQHNLSLSINLLNRLKGTTQQPSFTELTCTFNYAFTF